MVDIDLCKVSLNEFIYFCNIIGHIISVFVNVNRRRKDNAIAKRKGIKRQTRSTNFSQKTKDREIRIPLKTRVSSSCSTKIIPSDCLKTGQIHDTRTYILTACELCSSSCLECVFIFVFVLWNCCFLVLIYEYFTRKPYWPWYLFCVLQYYPW